MICRVSDLQRRDVICLKDGARLGTVGDVELDTGTARLSAVLVYGRPRFFGLIGRPQPVRCGRGRTSACWGPTPS